MSFAVNDKYEAQSSITQFFPYIIDKLLDQYSKARKKYFLTFYRFYMSKIYKCIEDSPVAIYIILPAQHFYIFIQL